MKNKTNVGSAVRQSLMLVGITAMAIALAPTVAQAEEQQTEVAARPDSSELVLQQKFQLTEAKGAIAPTGQAADLLAQTTPAPVDSVPLTPAPEPSDTPSTPGVESVPPAPATEAPSDEPAGISPPQTILETGVRSWYRLGYLGAGVNAGVTGDPALGDTGFTAFSKIPLGANISIRPTIVFSDDVAILAPFTYDFQIGPSDLPRAMPYVGAGLALNVGDDTDADLLLTAGIDVPLSRQWTVTGAANASLFDSFDLGLLFGIAYNFVAEPVEARVITGLNPELVESLRAPRPNPSFLGVGANLGVTGDDALGNSSFAVLGKIAFDQNWSIRPSALIEDDWTFLIPVTYDFPRIETDFATLIPYVGAGVAFSTGDDSEFDMVITGGIDVPITRDIAVTSGVSITPFDSFDLGVQLGVVFTFGSY